MTRFALTLVFSLVALLTAQDSPSAKPADPAPPAEAKKDEPAKTEAKSDGAESPEPAPRSTEPRLPNEAQERVLQGLLRDQSRRPIPRRVPETGQPADTPGADDRALLLEGQMLVMRQGRLETLSDRAEFHFYNADESGLAMIELLPNQTREFMERLYESGITEFVITGEIQRYRGKNYLLVRKADPHRGNGNLAP